MAESIIGLYKTEVIQRKGPWRHLERVEFATLHWVDWFNTRRLLEPIGYVPPAEYKARYSAALGAAAVLASPGGAQRHPHPSHGAHETAAERLQDVLRPLTNEGEQPDLQV